MGVKKKKTKNTELHSNKGSLPNNCFITSMLCSHRLLKEPQRDLPSYSGLFFIQPPQAKL